MTEPPEPGGNSYERVLGTRRNRIQNQLYENLKKVPGIEEVRYQESGTGIDHDIVGVIDTQIFADGVIEADESWVKVNWWPQPDGQSWFQIHYVEENGFNCGWHRQENNHVDGLDHYQEEEPSTDEVTYEPVNFEFDRPVGLLWEIVNGRLVERLKERY